MITHFRCFSSILSSSVTTAPQLKHIKSFYSQLSTINLIVFKFFRVDFAIKKLIIIKLNRSLHPFFIANNPTP